MQKDKRTSTKTIIPTFHKQIQHRFAYLKSKASVEKVSLFVLPKNISNVASLSWYNVFVQRYAKSLLLEAMILYTFIKKHLDNLPIQNTHLNFELRQLGNFIIAFKSSMFSGTDKSLSFSCGDTLLLIKSFELRLSFFRQWSYTMVLKPGLFTISSKKNLKIDIILKAFEASLFIANVIHIHYNLVRNTMVSPINRGSIKGLDVKAIRNKFHFDLFTPDETILNIKSRGGLLGLLYGNAVFDNSNSIGTKNPWI